MMGPDWLHSDEVDQSMGMPRALPRYWLHGWFDSSILLALTRIKFYFRLLLNTNYLSFYYRREKIILENFFLITNYFFDLMKFYWIHF